MQQRTSHKALVEKDVCCPFDLFLLIVLDENGAILEEISRGGLRIHTRVDPEGSGGLPSPPPATRSKF